MKQLFNKIQTAGLKYFDRNSSSPDDGYQVYSNYVFLELHRNEYYLDFYIVPSKDGNCILLGYIPELSLIDNLRKDKIRLLKLMLHSKLFAKVLKDSLTHKSNNLFNFTAINDFTEDNRTDKRWCVKYSSSIPYNQNIFNEELPESQFIAQILGELCFVADDYYGVYNAYNLDATNKEWIRSPKITAISKYAYKLHKENWCTFGSSLNDFEPKLKELLLKEGYILLTPTGIAYPFDIPVEKKDIGNSNLIVRADLFFPHLNKENFAYFINLEKENDKWKASINIHPELIRIVDTMLNNVDTKNNKIPALSYKYLPISSHIWVNSIEKPRYNNIKDYIDIVLKSDETIADEPFNDNEYKNIIKKGNSLIYASPLSIDFTNRPWHIPTAISDLIFYGIVISYEIYNIATNYQMVENAIKNRKSKQWTELSLNILKIVGKISRFS